MKPYPEGAGHRGVETSMKAASSVNAKHLREKILEILKEHPRGLTSYDISEILSMPFFSVQPRLSELNIKGLVYDSKERRRGRSKQTMTVWQLTPQDQIKPINVKMRPIGNPDLFGAMMQKIYAYGKEPNRLNEIEMEWATKTWAKAFSGALGNINYTIEGK